MSSSWIHERRKIGTKYVGAVDAAPAATVVLLRDADTGLEVLLERRSSNLKFHGGAWVFPGGRIDPDDYADDFTDVMAAARRAAAREAKEEAGLDVDPDALVHFSNWTTPDGAPKRFATWFFVGPVAGGNAIADGAETDALQWFRPDEAIAAHEAGEIELAPPQHVTLLDLRAHPDVEAALAAVVTAEPIDYLPRFLFADDGTALCIYSEDVAYDDFTRLDVEGPRHRLYLRDAGWEYLRDW